MLTTAPSRVRLSQVALLLNDLSVFQKTIHTLKYAVEEADNDKQVRPYCLSLLAAV